MKSRIVTTIAILVFLGLMGGIILSATTRSNCGGNSYTLYACEQYLLLVRLATNVSNSDFEISKLGNAEKVEAAKLAKSHWIGGADFLVRTNFSNPRNGRSVIIVCEQPFGNVPQPNLWNFYRKNPAYAVGYSNGSTGLIPPEEYAALDLSSFVSLSSLGTNTHAQIVQP